MLNSDQCMVRLLLFWVVVTFLAGSYGLIPEHGVLVTTDVPSSATASVISPTVDVTLPRQKTWSGAALRYISTLDCRRVRFTTNKECQRLVKIDLNMTNVYLAIPSASQGRMVAIFPESTALQSELERHDGVLAVDPYPSANFGHLVVVFYVDMNRDREKCERDGGIWLQGFSDCLQLAVQKRCKNSLLKRHMRRNFARRCEINFLPLVHFLPDRVNRTQQLICRPYLSLLPCPVMRLPVGGSSSDVTSCNPLRKNTKRCETTHEIFESTCHVLKICDQAVILSGGWNPWSQKKHHTENVYHFYRMLRKNGFDERNIKVFYADGRLPSVSGGDSGRRKSSAQFDIDVHPATESKMAMRYEIQRLCSTRHCVDSFILYLNSPSTSDGSALLWDLDHDGVAGENERYSLDELVSDLDDCRARHLHVIVDQSYSGNLLRAFKRYKRHPNVMVYASSKDVEYSFADDFTRVWTQANHTAMCTKAVFKRAKKRLRHSTPQLYTAELTSNVNIYGAPCDVRPRLTQEELRETYLGCQNLPWTMDVLRPTTQETSANRPPVAQSPRVANNTTTSSRRQRTSRRRKQ